MKKGGNFKRKHRMKFLEEKKQYKSKEDLKVRTLFVMDAKNQVT